MNFVDFQAALAAPAPPADLSPTLRALWHDGKGDWDAAHEALQNADGADGAWVHAYLHRKEGDLSNARYWYNRAGQPTATGPLAAEWEALVRAMLPQE